MGAGRVSGVHPGGFLLCKGPCIETTMPVVFRGMSGGPVMRMGSGDDKLQAFGLISSDFDFQDPAAKPDRSQKGSSVMAVLGATVRINTAGQREVLMRLNEGFGTLNKDELARISNDKSSVG
jgi:hypothetical protein